MERLFHKDVYYPKGASEMIKKLESTLDVDKIIYSRHIQNRFLCTDRSHNFTKEDVEFAIKKVKNLPVESVKHCSELLRDEKENRYFGGLRDLGFNKKSANYLKAFVKEIAQLFEDITAENNAQKDDIVSDFPFVFGGEDTPVQNGCEVQAIQDDVEVHTPREDDVEVQTHLEADKNQLSAVFALQHKTELDNFFKALEEVESIGLTAELILSKRAEIEQLLRVSTLF